MESSQNPKKRWGWLVVVLCAAVLVAALGLWLGDFFHAPLFQGKQDPAVDYGEELARAAEWPVVEGTFVYNEGEEHIILTDEHADRFSEKLAGEELAAVMPDTLPEWAQGEVKARFSEKRELVYVEMELPTTQSDVTVRIKMGEELYAPSYQTIAETHEGKRSKCGNVEYAVYRCTYEAGDGTRFALNATTTINETNILFSAYGKWQLEEQAKKDFEAILESFATYAQGKPDLTVITPKSKPVVTD